MSDGGVIEPFGVPEIFVDGFTQFASQDGVMTCVGYRKLAAGRVAVLRVAWPAVNTTAAINEAIGVLSAPVQAAQSEVRPKRGVH